MRLIDADTLKEKMRRTNRYFDVKFDIDEAPTIDAVPVVHGRWIEMERVHYFKCSRCRNPIPYKFGWRLYDGVVANKRYYNYCPNCGAKMDGDK